MSPDTIVTWKWRGTTGYSKEMYDGPVVNHLAAAVRKHYSLPHRFVCVTDDATGIDEKLVEVINPSVWPDQALRFDSLVSPHGQHGPSCFRRLRAFDPDIARYFGDRFAVLDLDMVVVGSLDRTFNRVEDFVMLRDPTHSHQFNGSMLMMTAGARPEVFLDFSYAGSRAALADGYYGSDQGWISHKLLGYGGKEEAMFEKSDGVYSYLRDRLSRAPMPANAALVSFHGLIKPWHPQALAREWVRQHWLDVYRDE